MLENFWDLLFPKYCLSCQKEGSFWCKPCYSLWEVNQFNFCLYCKKLNAGITCQDCLSKLRLDGFWTIMQINDYIKEALHYYKYFYIREMEDIFEHWIDDFLNNNQKLFRSLFPKDTGIISVPLHKRRLLERGFNQSDFFARFIAKKTNILYLDRLLLRKHYTHPQAELNRKDRLNNLKDVFVFNNNFDLKINNIILVDDVYTTGATMHACVKVLKENGVENVWGISFASGVLENWL